MSTPPEFAALTAAIVYQTTILHLIERRITGCALRGPEAPRKRTRFIKAALLAIAAAGVVLLSGCVKTHIRIGDAEMTRTALLTKVEVPSIEVATNGTFKAAVKSDSRTELMEALARTILSPPH